MSEDGIPVLARALAAADGSLDAEAWIPFATVVIQAFPQDHRIIASKEYDVELMRLYRSIARCARRLVIDFLEPRDRAVALGKLAEALRELDAYEFHHGENNSG